MTHLFRIKTVVQSWRDIGYEFGISSIDLSGNVGGFIRRSIYSLFGCVEALNRPGFTGDSIP